MGINKNKIKRMSTSKKITKNSNSSVRRSTKSKSKPGLGNLMEKALNSMKDEAISKGLSAHQLQKYIKSEFDRDVKIANIMESHSVVKINKQHVKLNRANIVKKEKAKVAKKNKKKKKKKKKWGF